MITQQHRHIWFIALALMLILSPSVSAQTQPLCYSPTGHCISYPVQSFWQRNGGLPVFGYPVSTLAPETNADTNQVYLTQWFQRERLELHPENAAPYTILLGRLGVQRLEQQGRDWTTFPKASPSAPNYFAVTGHAIGERFIQYWSTHGLDLGDPGISQRESLALFGYPVSEPMTETNSSGHRVLTQWFERARFEYHPNNPAEYRVLLGLLGNEVRAGQNATAPFYAGRVEPIHALIAYYNAINRKEYDRAYSYWDSPGTSPTSTPPDYATFVRGYASTARVEVTLGIPQEQGAAGSIYATVPTVLRATQTDGSQQVFAGCYIMRRTSAGVDPRPDAVLWRLYNARISVAASTATPAALLPGISCQP